MYVNNQKINSLISPVISMDCDEYHIAIKDFACFFFVQNVYLFNVFEEH